MASVRPAPPIREIKIREIKKPRKSEEKRGKARKKRGKARKSEEQRGKARKSEEK
jgi:hypothetical protein